MKIDLYFWDSEMNRVAKEKNRLKEDLKSLRKDYVALNKASKPRKLRKSSIEWRTEITTLEKKLHQ